MPRRPDDDAAAPDERWQALHDLEEWLEGPMIVLSFIWLALLVLELTRGLPPLLEGLGWVIWGAFVLDFVLRFALAPVKRQFFARNWLTALSLVVPALRVFRGLRGLRALRAVRGVRLVKTVSSLNRGMRALGQSFRRRGMGYVVALTLLFTLAGAAAIHAFERDVPGSPLGSYGASLWWTAMVMTTMGSDYFPKTGEGRILCVLLAVYAFAVFGYVTATLATFFIGRDAERSDAEIAGQRAIDALAGEV
ncbi:MAG TPA: ion transporter, partial [Gemmatimonadaceae bacterium]|nr:ion transporter [Gemmatimonadaceae bacterium]